MVATSRRQQRRSLSVGLLLGVGGMAAVDEIVFHQLLAWHHFYDKSTAEVALLSDGLLHTGELVLLVVGFFLLADLRRSHALAARSTWAGWFLGLGLFQLWDGLVDHKVLRVHQVRYGVDLLPYDLLWNGAGVALALLGLLLLRHRGRQEPGEAGSSRA